MISKDDPCCEQMGWQLSHECADHPNPWDCPDALIGSFEDGRIGLMIHDGGTSLVLIAYCPWCATPTGVELDD